MRAGIITALVLHLLMFATAFAAEPAALQPFAFLVGEWAATGSGQPGDGIGTAVFTRDLQDNVIVRKSYAEYPAVDGKPASRHEDLMVIHAAGDGPVRAEYYDSEGHVIRYVVSSPKAGEAVFLSPPAPGQPRYRLSYALAAEGVLKGEFAVSPTGAADGFKPNLTWESRTVIGVAR
jgi:hypothetical protein